MSVTVVMIVQWLHILFGMVWLGSNLFIDLVLWPTWLRLPASEAQASYDALRPAIGKLMGAGGSMVMLLGILRGTVFGGVRSLEFLFGTAYGLTWLAALILAGLLAAWGGSWHDRFVGPVWVDGRLQPDAVGRLRTARVIEFVGFGLILAFMVLMRFGY